jgi:hypothetical protein
MSPSRGENDNERAVATAFGPSAYSLFLPAVVILAGYALFVLAWWAAGRGDGLVAQLGLIAASVAVPLLVIHAVLRLKTVSVRFEPRGLVLAPGFPSPGEFAVAWHDIADVDVTGGRLTGGRTLVVEDSRGHRIVVRGLAGAEEAATLIRARSGQFQGVAVLLGGLSAMGGRRNAGDA